MSAVRGLREVRLEPPQSNSIAEALVDGSRIEGQIGQMVVVQRGLCANRFFNVTLVFMVLHFICLIYLMQIYTKTYLLFFSSLRFQRKKLIIFIFSNIFT